MVDFSRGFSCKPTELQKKITNLLQSSEVIQQKQKDLVMINLKFKYIKYF